MFIIFVAHVPNNPWTLWIPARFGFSDATEIFVFCSGMASAFAFGRIFVARGWWVGTARTLFRAWQIYWVHVCLFLALAAALASLDGWGRFGTGYLDSLNLNVFFADPKPALIGLLTLRYVPNYFDILPMYFGILLMLPLVVAARQAGFWIAAALVWTVWLLAQLGWLGLPADPWSEREWFFNPFGWQLVFFTGFAFASGWIPAPPVRTGLVLFALGLVVLSVPFAYFRIIREVALVQSAVQAIGPLIGKPDFGILRYGHFLAVAYLAWAAAGPHGARLAASGAMARVVAVIHKVGQQALATFVAGTFLARMTQVIFFEFGKSVVVVGVTNVLGFAALILTAYVAGWFRADRAGGRKSAPEANRALRPVRPDRDPVPETVPQTEQEARASDRITRFGR